MLPRPDVIQLYTHAAVFCCPSVYEPFGIINLEAMACGTPVVASAVGGIKEVVVPEETGLLVDPDLRPGSFDPADPAAFAAGLADGINRLAENAGLRARFADAGRRRVAAAFQLGRDRGSHRGAVPRSGRVAPELRPVTVMS